MKRASLFAAIALLLPLVFGCAQTRSLTRKLNSESAALVGKWYAVKFDPAELSKAYNKMTLVFTADSEFAVTAVHPDGSADEYGGTFQADKANITFFLEGEGGEGDRAKVQYSLKRGTLMIYYPEDNTRFWYKKAK
jgi:hypothetical protein